MVDATHYVLGGTPYLCLETNEIKRGVSKIQVNSDKVTKYTFNIIEGIRELAETSSDGSIIYKYQDVNEFLDILPALSQKAIVVAELFDIFFENAEVIQKMLNITYLLKHNQICLCIVTTDRNRIPAPLEPLFTVLDLPLPTKEDFRKFLREQCEDLGVKYIESVADACVGLSMEEGENAMVKMLLDCKCCNLESVIEAKKAMYAKTGFMQLIMPTKREDFGGYEEAVDNFIRRKTAWEPDSIKPKMRAIIAVGVPGCGKTELAKMFGNLYQIPVLAVDLGTASGGVVGESERKIRQVTKIIDASGFVVAVFDEFEKSLGGAGGRALDGGVSDDKLGHLLKWLQDRTSEAIVFATVNDISRLPSEILRAGRWDEMYFFGFPNSSERRQILEIMNRKWKANVPVTDEIVAKLEKFTGAEIQEVAKKSHFYDDVDEILGKIPRLWNSKREAMEELLKFSTQMQNASKPDVVKKAAPIDARRTLDIGKSVSSMDELKKTIKEKIL